MQTVVGEPATMHTGRPPTAQCWTQRPDPHEPQVAPRVAHVGSVVLVLLGVDAVLVVVVDVVVVAHSTSLWQFPHAVQQRWYSS